MEKTHFAFGESRITARTLAKHRGKIGASARPASIALATIAGELRLRINRTTAMNASASETVNNRLSEIQRTIRGTRVRPNRSAIQKHDAAAAAHTLLEAGRRR